MRTGPVLASDLIDRYEPLGAFGQPVYLGWVQLRATIAQKLGPRHANYFARPDRDPQTKSIHWIAEVAGTAVRWSELSAEEQTLYALDLQAMRSDFLRYLAELRRQGGGTSGDGKGAAAFASLLQQALLVPDDSHLHFVGDQPVVSFWGFRNIDGQGFDPLTAVPQPSPPAGLSAAAPPERPAGGGVSVPFQPRQRPWWRWLLWALALLLLILLLLFGLAWCARDDIRERPAGPAATGEPPAPGRLPQQEGGIVDRTLRYLGLQEAPLGDAIPAPQGEAVVPGVPIVPDAGQTPVPGAVPAVPEEARPGGQTTPESVRPEGRPPSGDPANPETPRPDAPGAPPKQDQPPGQQSLPPQPPQDPGAKGQTLQIPPDAGKAGDVGFVGGEWRSDSGLVDQVTKQPLRQTYRFDDTGKGEVVIRRADGVECRASAQATMRGGRLGIDELGQPTCPDGRTFSRSQTECTRTPSGQTVCQGRNADGSTYRVGIERAAPKP